MKITERRLRSIIRSVIRESRADKMLDYHVGHGDHPDYDPAVGQDRSETLFDISGDRPTEPYSPPMKVSKQLMDSARANSYLQKYSPLKSRIQGSVSCKRSSERFPDGWSCSVKLSEDGRIVPVIIHMSYDGDIEVQYM
jgi:hypothetical protein